MCHTFFFLKIFYLFIFRERAKEGEREGEKHQLVASHMPPAGAWPTTQAHALTGNWTGDPLVHRPLRFNPLSHNQPGLAFNLKQCGAGTGIDTSLAQHTKPCVCIYTHLRTVTWFVHKGGILSLWGKGWRVILYWILTRVASDSQVNWKRPGLFPIAGLPV